MCDFIVFTLLYCYFLQIAFIFKHLFVILLLLQLILTGVTTYPIDGTHCNTFFKYLNRIFNHQAITKTLIITKNSVYIEFHLTFKNCI